MQRHTKPLKFHLERNECRERGEKGGGGEVYGMQRKDVWELKTGVQNNGEKEKRASGTENLNVNILLILTPNLCPTNSIKMKSGTEKYR